MSALLVLAVAFAAGSIPFSNLAARITRGVDLRTVGTGTVSGTSLLPGRRVPGAGDRRDPRRGQGGARSRARRGRPCDARRVRRRTRGGRAQLVALPRAAPAAGAWRPRSARSLVQAWPGAVLLLGGLVIGKFFRETGLGGFVAEVLLAPVLAVLDGAARRGSPARAIAVPMLVKRVAGNGRPTRSRRPHVPGPAAVRPRPRVIRHRTRVSVGDIVRRRGFRDLLVGQGVSALGDWMGTVAFMALALELTDSPTAVGGILTLRLLPAAIGGPLAARAGSKWDRRRTMLAMDVACAAMIALVPFIRVRSGGSTCCVPHRGGEHRVPPGTRRVDPRPRRRRRPRRRQRLVLGSSYGTIPIGAALFAAVAALPFVDLFGRPFALVFWIDAATFVVSFFCIARLTHAGNRHADERGGPTSGAVPRGVPHPARPAR